MKKSHKRSPCKARIKESEILSKLTALDKHISWLCALLETVTDQKDRETIQRDINRSHAAVNKWELELQVLWATGKKKTRA